MALFHRGTSGVHMNKHIFCLSIHNKLRRYLIFIENYANHQGKNSKSFK